MENKTEILALIPARSGSKSVIDKNIRMIGGHPMIAHSIRHALECPYITRTIVSTDSERYAQIARQYGAEVPFIRPAELATDTALDVDVFYHALKYLQDTEGYRPRLVVQLRPTCPVRRISDINAMIEIMLKDETLDSVRSVVPAKEIPYKMWFQNDDGVTIRPVIDDPPECYNMPRQELKTAYYQNACIDVLRPWVVLEQHSMSGIKIGGYIMKDFIDIDTEEDFEEASRLMQGE